MIDQIQMHKVLLVLSFEAETIASNHVLDTVELRKVVFLESVCLRCFSDPSRRPVESQGHPYVETKLSSITSDIF